MNDHSRLRDGLGLTGLTAVILGFFLLRYPVRSFTLPMGPDGPVYLWWSSLASREGLQVANWRPGVPGLALVFGSVLHLSQVQVLAAFGAVFAAVAGLAATALVKSGVAAESRQRFAPLLAGLLCGAFAVNLAGGYFGNIVFAALFLAAAAILIGVPNRRGTAGAAILMAGGGLAHPLFFVVGLAILLLTAAAIRKTNRSGARRILAASASGAAVVGGGLLAMFAGPRPVAVDTSADAFLRRAGLTSSLAAEYRERLGHHWARYTLWLNIPLAYFGRKTAGKKKEAFLRRFLVMWIAVTLAGLVAALATGAVPGLRMLSFAYALPVLAALGVARLAGKRPSLVFVPIALALAGIIVFGSALTWFREKPYVSPSQLEAVNAAAAAVRETPAGTPLVFIVDEPNPNLVGFHVIEWGNIIRAGLPPDRIRSVVLYVGSPADYANARSSAGGGSEHDAISRLYLSDTLAALKSSSLPPLVCVLTPFNPAGTTPPGPTSPCAPGTQTDAPISTGVRPASSWGIVLGGVLMFAFLAAVGLGWAFTFAPAGRWTWFGAPALAPAFGAAVLILVSVFIDRLGIRLTGAAPLLASVSAGLGGYAAARRSRNSRKFV